MKPCDCKDMYTARTKLKEQGLKYNDIGIELRPSKVILINGPGQLSIPQHTFEAFARWYLEDQGEDHGN